MRCFSANWHLSTRFSQTPNILDTAHDVDVTIACHRTRHRVLPLPSTCLLLPIYIDVTSRSLLSGGRPVSSPRDEVTLRRPSSTTVGDCADRDERTSTRGSGRPRHGRERDSTGGRGADARQYASRSRRGIERRPSWSRHVSGTHPRPDGIAFDIINEAEERRLVYLAVRDHICRHAAFRA
jgi:hypothetical protein